MTTIEVLDETRRAGSLADEISQVLNDTTPLIADITALTPPPAVRFLLLTPRAWRAELFGYACREVESSFERTPSSAEEETEARKTQNTYLASMAVNWPQINGRTVIDSEGQPLSLIAPRALHHTGLRYASRQLHEFIVHESVHQWQIATSRGAVMPTPFLPRDLKDPLHAPGLVHLSEGHAEWTAQQVACQMFGDSTDPQLLRQSWQSRWNEALTLWLARRAARREAGAAGSEQADNSDQVTSAECVHFVEAAIKGAGGVTAFNKVWRDPDFVPLPGEISAPDSWIRRVGFLNAH